MIRNKWGIYCLKDIHKELLGGKDDFEDEEQNFVERIESYLEQISNRQFEISQRLSSNSIWGIAGVIVGLIAAKYIW